MRLCVCAPTCCTVAAQDKAAAKSAAAAVHLACWYQILAVVAVVRCAACRGAGVSYLCKAPLMCYVMMVLCVRWAALRDALMLHGFMGACLTNRPTAAVML
jgi:uncharacterized membrane protein (DUF441 family)